VELITAHAAAASADRYEKVSVALDNVTTHASTAYRAQPTR
jgi:hypothetical protein